MNAMDFDKARYNMVEQQVRPWDVLDTRVLDVISEVPREAFVPDRYKNLAYVDTRIPLGTFEDHTCYMMNPNVQGRILQYLDISDTDSVLEIGTGNGYLTACMARLAHHVDSVDINPDFSAAAQQCLAAQGIDNVNLSTGDASQNWEQKQAYDVIAITGAMPNIPEGLKKSLKPGGRMFIITGDAPAMTAKLVSRVDKNEWMVEDLFETVVEPLVNTEKAEEFVF